jgi:hypothetical protein
MTEKISLFETPLWISFLNLDTDSLEREVKIFSFKKESSKMSNIGGYQGHEFNNKKLMSSIVNSLPLKAGTNLESFRIYSWVNINKSGDRNERHSHLNTNIFLSGVYYIKVPENSGNIRFYDPRGHLTQEFLDYKYFYNGYSYHYITPQKNMLLLFPCWVEHDVEENSSNEERISISFNITCDELQQ